MSALSPGLYRATVRGGIGAPDTMVYTDGITGYWLYQGLMWSTPIDRITDARPLIVLDLDENDARHLVSYLEITVERHPDQLGTVGRAVYTNVAAQVAQQTKPARIPEPGLWGVVEASFTSQRIQQPFLRDNLKANVGGGWVSIYGPPETDKRRVEWDDLIDPTLIREGLS